MKPKILQWLSLIIAVCGGILALADTITPIAAINPSLSHSWPIVLVAATIVSRVAAIVADKLKEMPLIILFAMVANLNGCTTLYRDGVKTASIGSNIGHFALHDGSYSVEMDQVDNAIIHREVGNNSQKLGIGICTSGILPWLKGIF